MSDPGMYFFLFPPKRRISWFCVMLYDFVDLNQELRGRRYRTCIGQNDHNTSKSLEREMYGKQTHARSVCQG